MSQTAPPAGTTPPTAPSRASPSTFATRSDAWLAWCETSFYDWVVSIGTNLYDNAVDAYNNAVAGAASQSAAAVSESAAATSANQAATSAGATIWVSGTTYAIGDVRWSPSNRYSYRRITSGAGTTDPSADATNWALAGVSAPGLVVNATTTQAAIANTHYLMTNGSASTVTLPASPSVGDVIWVTFTNGLITNVIACNTKNIMALAENLTVNVPTLRLLVLRYVDVTRGWIVA